MNRNEELSRLIRERIGKIPGVVFSSGVFITTVILTSFILVGLLIRYPDRISLPEAENYEVKGDTLQIKKVPNVLVKRVNTDWQMEVAVRNLVNGNLPLYNGHVVAVSQDDAVVMIVFKNYGSNELQKLYSQLPFCTFRFRSPGRNLFQRFFKE